MECYVDNKKQNNIRNACKALICFGLFLAMLIICALVLKRKKSDIEYRAFYEKPEEYEVLFFGPSSMHNDILPMELWHEYGIASYNMGNDSEVLAMTYYDIEIALHYANPKLIVVDLNSMSWAGIPSSESNLAHDFWDSVPFSKFKYEEAKKAFYKEDVFEYMFPFSLYHSRWKEVAFSDAILNQRGPYYGSQVLYGSVDTEKPTKDKYEESRFGATDEESQNMNKIIQLCKDNNIEVVFTYLPNGARGGDQKYREFCNQYLASVDVDYIDLLDADFIDWHKDFVDGTHLNYEAAKKMTAYIGDYLKSRYELDDYRDKPVMSETWNKDYDAYIEAVNREMEL